MSWNDFKQNTLDDADEIDIGCLQQYCSQQQPQELFNDIHTASIWLFHSVFVSIFS